MLATVEVVWNYMRSKPVETPRGGENMDREAPLFDAAKRSSLSVERKMCFPPNSCRAGEDNKWSKRKERFAWDTKKRTTKRPGHPSLV